LLTRDAMRKSGLCCRPVSVRHVGVFQTDEDIVKLLTRPGSLIILIFTPSASIGPTHLYHACIGARTFQPGRN